MIGAVAVKPGARQKSIELDAVRAFKLNFGPYG
jgi:hypothetical protein